MKILWLCNVVLPRIAEDAGISQKIHSAGWIEGFLNSLVQNDKIELGILCPYNKLHSGTFANVKYWLCPSDMYCKVVSDFSPDILHVYGTENEDWNRVIKHFGKPERTVVNIQGMMNLYGEVYLQGLPPELSMKERLFEKYIGNSLIDQKQSFEARGKIERDTLLNVGHVIGRTDIDKMFATNINDRIKYHFCNEILRDEFYGSDKWSLNSVQIHSIMIRSTNNPIKGLYQMLFAMSHIIKKYPDAMLYVVGNGVNIPQNAKQKITESSYSKLIRETTQKLGLEKHIQYCGTLTSKEMKDMYLKSHVAVSASIIENESNFVSEAKILGVPVVSSYVGGVINRIAHGKDGLLYPFNMPEMLAFYISNIFDDDGFANSISQNAIESQQKINDRTKNITRLNEIYNSIMNHK